MATATHKHALEREVKFSVELRRVALAVFLLATAGACLPRDLLAQQHRRPDAGTTIRRIAFGSCLHQDRPAPILLRILDTHPDVMLLIGDNVYADTDDAERLRATYGRLAARPEYRALIEAVPVLAVWDDHDYGRDDAGQEFPAKSQAKEIMLDHFDEPATSPRRSRPGVYDAVVLGPPGRRVQIILLDTRWFRSPLVGSPGDYGPDPSPDATMLGEAQWRWLDQELQRPAELRLLVSSIQVLADQHPFEKWGNFPRERERLLRLLERSRAAGVVVLSGDRHRGELSRLPDPGMGYPLYDLTSSSLNLPIPGSDPNALRDGMQVMAANFGLIEIQWDAEPPTMDLELRDDKGAVRVRRRVALDALRPPDQR